jgi:hypothetical protein
LAHQCQAARLIDAHTGSAQQHRSAAGVPERCDLTIDDLVELASRQDPSRAEAKRQPEDIRTRMATVMTALPLVTA